jgi:hypothetical protein
MQPGVFSGFSRLEAWYPETHVRNARIPSEICAASENKRVNPPE